MNESADELERLALEEVVKRCRHGNPPTALILPAGKGELAVEMAHLRAAVTAIEDAAQVRDLQGRMLAAGLRPDEVGVATGSLLEVPSGLAGEPFDIVFCRRGLSSLPYDQARTTVRRLLSRLKIGGKLYLSLLGLNSELGYDYPGAEHFLECRFSPLHPDLARKYGIEGPLCLYTERNLFQLLLEAGGSVLRTFTSTHGNVKGVAVRV